MVTREVKTKTLLARVTPKTTITAEVSKAITAKVVRVNAVVQTITTNEVAAAKVTRKKSVA